MRALALVLVTAYSFIVACPSAFAFDGETSLEYEADRSANVALSVGSGATVLNGEVGWGFSFLGAREWSNGGPTMVGLETGLYFWSRGGGQRDPLGMREPLASGSASLLRVLPVLYHQFLIPMVPGAVPFLGVSAGPAFYFVSGTALDGTTVKTTQVFLEVLLRPGIHMILTEEVGLWLEPRLGFVKSDFVFNPQVSLSWFL